MQLSYALYAYTAILWITRLHLRNRITVPLWHFCGPYLNLWRKFVLLLLQLSIDLLDLGVTVYIVETHHQIAFLSPVLHKGFYTFIQIHRWCINFTRKQYQFFWNLPNLRIWRLDRLKSVLFMTVNKYLAWSWKKRLAKNIHFKCMLAGFWLMAIVHTRRHYAWMECWWCDKKYCQINKNSQQIDR